MTDPMVELGKLMTLSLAISVLGFGFMMACLVYLAKQLGEARASTARIAESTERIAAMTQEVLRRLPSDAA